jgi:hypothetical protein
MPVEKEHHFSGDLRSELRLIRLLEVATGLDAVPTTSHPEANKSADVMVEQATSQRFALQARGEGLALCTWPAELKAQATAFYQADQVARFLNFLTEKDQAWRAEPMPQLAFRSAAASQRVFLHCHLGIDEYVHRWLGDDFACVGAHERDRIWPSLWPWLLERGYADPADEQPLEALLTRLGKRDVFLRPGIAMGRIWPWAEAEDLDRRGALADEISAAITSALTVLGEPLIPVRAGTDTATVAVRQTAGTSR